MGMDKICYKILQSIQQNIFPPTKDTLHLTMHLGRSKEKETQTEWNEREMRV